MIYVYNSSLIKSYNRKKNTDTNKYEYNENIIF